ncbi:alpha-glucan phosphorylase [Caballeronia jiangsuensis]|nr:alpha-glucan phosphorylase [Caballeronia jiangsuensis]
MTLITPFLKRTRIAYFSMEIAIHPDIPTCAGGLGVLAGDTARSCADLELPVVFVSLVSRAGYFRQRIGADGRQVEEPDTWDPAAWCTPMDAMIAVRIEQRMVWIRPWLYVHSSDHGHMIPVLLLDTDLPQNAPEDRTLTHFLYGGDDAYRLKQEIVLGIGGARVLRALGFALETHHLNEGHAALLLLELLGRSYDKGNGKPQYDTAYVRSCCVFTTHTPVESGHDHFSYELFQHMLPDFIPLDMLKQYAGHECLNMTRRALNLAGFVNGVARRHAETTAHLFPGYPIHAITNGVHPQTWVHSAFAELYSRNFPHWRHEPERLVRALRLPEDDVWRCHEAAKQHLIDEIERRIGNTLSRSVPIIGFARRMTGYKRPTLLFQDLARLAAIAEKRPFQIVIAGKAHPRDAEGKSAIEAIHAIARELEGKVMCVFLPNYDMRIAQALVGGCDIWLNTPLPPFEASGTSGMKAALNGVLNLSILDGWWVEACIEGVTGWGIDDAGDDEQAHVRALYAKLGEVVLPLYYGEPGQWRRMMKQSIAHIASYFNSQRMMRRYASEAYLR